MAGMDANSKKLNEELFNALCGGTDPAKQAQDAVNDLVRTTMREDSFHRCLFPSLLITDDDLDRAVECNKPVKVLDHEDLAAAWACSVDAPVAIVVDGDDVLYLPGECNPLQLRRPRVLVLD